MDVSKDRLDVTVLPDRKSFSVDTNAAGYSELVKRQSILCRRLDRQISGSLAF